MSLRWPAAPAPVVPADALPPQPRVPRVKVLHVITRFWAGAGGNTLLSAVGMDPARYEVWVAGCPGGPLWARARDAGVHTVELHGFREVLAPATDLWVLMQLVRLMRRERFTIVHTHSAKGGFLGRVAARLTRTPVVVHTFHGFSFHEYMSPARRRSYLALERLVRRFTHEFFAVAPRVAREAVELRLAAPAAVSVVPSAVSLHAIPDRADPAARAELGLRTSAPVVGTVGRIDFQKSSLDFVRMAAGVRAVRPDAQFVMVGDGPLEADVRDEAERLGVPLTLTGYRPDAARLASAFDVFVITSLYEGLGRALTEALASGRPVVATAVNGVPDLVEPGATGLLAAPTDVEGLIADVLWLLEHPREASDMGDAGRRRVRTTFEPATMCALLDEAYCRLIGAPPPSSIDERSDTLLVLTGGIADREPRRAASERHVG